MNILRKQFGVTTEIFASPSNHFYERYFSLFAIDYQFGGLGNCLNNEILPATGFEANPPFIESVMEDSAKIIMKTIA